MYLRMTLIFLPQSPMDWHYICRPPLSALRSLLRSGEPPMWSSRTRPPAAASLHSTPAGRVGRGGRMRGFRRPFPGDPEASAWTRVFAGWRERARGGGACAGQGRARRACAAAGGCASRAGRWRQLRWSGECERRPGAAGPGAVRPRPRPPACPPWATRPAWRAARAKGRCRPEALVWVRAPEQGSRLQH